MTRINLAAETYWSSADVENGVAEWKLVPQGDYLLYTRAEGQMDVAVVGDTVVDWRPQPHNCIVLLSLDSGDVLAEAGLEAGDVIRSINGTRGEGYEVLNNALKEARKAGTARLGIERNGESFVIEIDGAKLDEGFKRAGYSFRRR